MRERIILGALVVLLVAGVLPSGVAARRDRTTRTISVPETVSGTRLLPARRGAARLDFAATHIAFSWTGDEGTGVRYRTLGPFGSSGWTRAPESGDMHAEDIHYSAMIPVERAFTVRYEPIERRGRTVGTITLDYLNTLDGTRSERTVGVSARAAGAETPNIITRAQWGADESIKRTGGGCKRTFYPVQQLFVHHTAGANHDNNPAATMRAVYWYHTVRRGWCDLGYNFVISWDGRIYEGRWARRYKPWETHSSENRFGRAVAGAHVSSFNSGSVGISLMGNFQRAKVPNAMRAALVRLLAWEADRHDLPPRGRHLYRNPDTGQTKRLAYISGHRDAGQTSCPGGNLYRTMRRLRRQVANEIGDGKPATEVTLQAQSKKVKYGEQAILTGRLRTEAGVPLAGRRVNLWRRTGPNSRWKEAASPLTGTDGTFSYSFVPQRNGKTIAVFPDASDAWGSQSRTARVKVQHTVALRAMGGTPDATGTVVYPPGTTTVALEGNAAPVHGDAVIKLRVSRVEEDGDLTELVDVQLPIASDGGFAYDFKVPSQVTTTRYRSVARYPGDRGHVFGKSSPVDFIVGS